jgi:hypothetical protein
VFCFLNTLYGSVARTPCFSIKERTWCPRRNPCQERLVDQVSQLVGGRGQLVDVLRGHVVRGNAGHPGDVDVRHGGRDHVDLRLDRGLVDRGVGVGRRSRSGCCGLGGLLLLAHDAVDAGGEVAVDERSLVVGDVLLDGGELGLEGLVLGVGRRGSRRSRGGHGVGGGRSAVEGETCVGLTGEGRDRRENSLEEPVTERLEEVLLLVLRDGRVLVESLEPAGGVPEGVVELGGVLVGGRLGGGGQIGCGDGGHGCRISLVGSAWVPNNVFLTILNYSAPRMTGVVVEEIPQHDA